MQNRTVARMLRCGVLACLLAVVSWTDPGFAQEKTADTPSREAAVPATSAPGGGSADVAFKDGKLTVNAEKAHLPSLLRKIAESAGVAIEISPDVAGEVSVVFADVSVEDGVKRILEASGRTNFAAEFKRSGGAAGGSIGLEKMIIAPGRRGQVPDPAKSVGSFDALYNHIRSKYGKYEAFLDKRTGRLRDIKFHEAGVSQKINRENMEEYCRSKFEEFFPLLGLSMEMFIFEGVREDAVDTVCVFPQVVGGVPVEGAAVSVGVWKPSPGKNANDLVGFGNRVHPDINISTEPKITAEEALAIAQERYRSDTSGKPGRVADDINKRRPTQLVVYPMGDRPEGPSRFEYFLSWRVDLGGGRFYVDAAAGRVLSWRSSEAHLSGTLRGRRYGEWRSGVYKEDFVTKTHTEGLGDLYIWRASDTKHEVLPAIRTLPADLPPPNDDKKKGYFEVAGSEDLPIYTRLDSGTFKVRLGGTVGQDGTATPGPLAEWTSRTDGTDLTTEPFPEPDDGSDDGHTANIYHQLFRGLKWLVDNHGPTPPSGLEVWSAAPGLGEMVQGSTSDNVRIRLIGSAGMSSDTILHELAHAAVYTHRKSDVGASKSQKAVSEGLAEFFAARTNNDPVMEPGAAYVQHHLDGRGSLLETTNDWDQDGSPDGRHFSHYDNGEALASALWDLHVGGMADSTIWKAIQQHTVQGAMAEGAYSPEEFYEALKYFEADAPQLWTDFSRHGINLWARPGAWDADGKPLDPPDYGAVTLDWFDYHGFGGAAVDYVVERRRKGEATPDFQCRLSALSSERCSPSTAPELDPQISGWTGATRWIDHPPPPAGQEYAYAIYPWLGGTTWENLTQRSNLAEVTTDDGADVPQPAMRHELDGVTGTVTLLWEADPGVAGWVLDRYAVDADGTTSLQRTQDIARNGSAFQEYRDKNLQTGKYKYVFFALNAAGRRSEPDEEPVDVVNDPPEAPMWASAQCESDRITVGWLWPSPEPADLAGFAIYRRPMEQAEEGLTCSVGAPVEIAGVPYCKVADVGKTTSFTDGILCGAYHYAIRSVDVAGSHSGAAAYAEASKPISVALLIDRSGSMAEPSGSEGQSRIAAARSAAGMFLELVATGNAQRSPGNNSENLHKAGIFAVGQQSHDMREYGAFETALVPPCKDKDPAKDNLTEFGDVLGDIEAQVLAESGRQWTNIVSGLEKAWLTFNPLGTEIPPDGSRRSWILLLSDGEHNFLRGMSRPPHVNADVAVNAPYEYVTGASPKGEICQPPYGEMVGDVLCPLAGATFPSGIGISTVGFGSDISGEGQRQLEDLAGARGGTWYHVSDADADGKLKQAYAHMLGAMTGQGLFTIRTTISGETRRGSCRSPSIRLCARRRSS